MSLLVWKMEQDLTLALLAFITDSCSLVWFMSKVQGQEYCEVSVRWSKRSDSYYILFEFHDITGRQAFM